MTTLRSREGDSVPLILWLALGRDDDEAEEALHRLNPQLAHYGPILPAGVVIILPELAAPTPNSVVNVWD